MRLASESAEEEEIRLSRRQSRDRAKRAVQSSQATKNCRGSETAEARERTDSTEIEERGVSIQKARRKRTHDIDNLAIIHVSSCNDVQEMSLATFRIELGLHSMCMSRLHALYFMLRTPMTLAPRSAFSFFACSVRSTVIRVFFQTRPHTVTKAVDDLIVRIGTA